MSKPYLADWHHKLFIREMQAKGKLPKYVTEATERKEKAYHLETGQRVFPGPLGQEAVLDTLLTRAEERINNAAAKYPDAAGGASAEAGKAAAGVPVPGLSSSKSDRRRELKARLSAIESELRHERELRQKAEEQLMATRQTYTHKQQQQ